MSQPAVNSQVGGVPLEAGFYERLFHGAGLPIYSCDVEGRILGTNALGQALFAELAGWTEHASVAQLLPVEDGQILRESLERCAQTRQPAEFRTRVRRASGELIEYAVWFTPTLDEHGNLQGVSVWLHDITARLQVRRTARKRERLTTLGALSGAVAHHYNNLLCSIATSLEYAMNMNTISAMRRALQRTADAVGRAAQLTQQLLAFAQADHRCLDMSDLTETVLYYFDENEERLANLGIHVSLYWKPLPRVTVPREHLLVVVNNIVHNAVEAMPDGGTLTVKLEPADAQRVRLSIADSGPGIAPEHMEHLFEPFFTTKGELGDGLTRQAGMGLAVAHGLVSEMQGSISAANGGGGGASFEILLPVDVEEREAGR